VETSRSLKPYTGAPNDLRPFSKFTTPYHEYYQDRVEYNGAARELPDPNLKDLSEIRTGFIGPLNDRPQDGLGNRMLRGATLDFPFAGRHTNRPRHRAHSGSHSGQALLSGACFICS
jgi:hypothetical protein